MRREDEGPVLTPTEARQASPRKVNFRVLIGSLFLAVVAAVLLYMYFYGNSPA